jgi:hypothetical protein
MNRTRDVIRAKHWFRPSFWAMVLAGPVAMALGGCGGAPHASLPSPATGAVSRSPQASPQRWTSSNLAITPHALGAVRIGMTISQASAAAGQPLEPVGDGVLYPLGKASSGLSVVDSNGRVSCVSASDYSNKDHTVATPQGFALGGTLAQLKAVYKSTLRFVPAPNTGMDTISGYVVGFPDGNLVFWISGGIVRGIGGGPGLLPSSDC